MANFELKISTDERTELLELVTKLCRPDDTAKAVTEAPAVAVEGPAADHSQPSTPVAADAAPSDTTERDAHGIKFDSRIHTSSDNPFKQDGTWKKRRGVDDAIYDGIYAQLVDEALESGEYKGDDAPPPGLEERIEDADAPAPPAAPAAPTPAAAPAAPTPAAAPAAPTPTAAPAAPTPTAAPAAPTPTAAPAAPTPAGLSGEQPVDRIKLAQRIVQAGGVFVSRAMLRTCGVSAITDMSDEQIGTWSQIADELVAAAIPADANKAANGYAAAAAAAVNYGIELPSMDDLK